MQIKVNRFDSELYTSASIEAYKEKFPLPEKLSNKNFAIHIWLEHEDEIVNYPAITFLASQSRAALVIVHLARITINGTPTRRGISAAKMIGEDLEILDYQYIGGLNDPPVMVWGMMHPGLVYTE